MTEKALRYMGQLWAYERKPEPSGYTLSPGSWIAYREGGRLRVGLLREIYPEEGIYVVAYDEHEDIELEPGDIVSPARQISSRSELRG